MMAFACHAVGCYEVPGKNGAIRQAVHVDFGQRRRLVRCASAVGGFQRHAVTLHGEGDNIHVDLDIFRRVVDHGET
ncbi:hypothetical protein D3C87_1958820 [compost metagenome]